MPEAQPLSDDQFLMTWLFDRDTPCPLCGYNLRALSSARCPECGEKLLLTVALAEPYLKAWIGLLAGLLLPAGIGIIVIVSFLYALSNEGLSRTLRDTERMPVGIAFIMLHVIACLPLSIAGIAGRRRFLAWNRQMQRVCVAIAWGAILISLFSFLYELNH